MIGVVAGAGGMRGAAAASPADQATYADLFHAHFRALVRLAALLGADDPEDIAQEAFCRLHERMDRLRDPQAALAYARATVVNLTRSRLRRLVVSRRHNPDPLADVVSAEQSATLNEDRAEVVAALRTLSPRHREALVLRYWLDLSEADMAAAMNCSPGTVKSHVSRGLAALAKALPDREENR